MEEVAGEYGLLLSVASGLADCATASIFPGVRSLLIWGPRHPSMVVAPPRENNRGPLAGTYATASGWAPTPTMDKSDVAVEVTIRSSAMDAGTPSPKLMVLFYRRLSRSANFWRTASAWLHGTLVHGLLWPDVAEVFEDGCDVVDDELVDAAVRDPVQYVAQRL